MKRFEHTHVIFLSCMQMFAKKKKKKVISHELNRPLRLFKSNPCDY